MDENIQLKNCLQIGDNDLIGNKFNGHDLHFYLKEKGINTSHIVLNKYSHDDDTYKYPIHQNSQEFMQNLLYHPLFLDADIMHMHLIHNTPFDLNYIPLISKLKPLVWTIHDPWAFSGHCIYHFDCNQWKTSCTKCEKLDIPFFIEKDTTALNFRLKKDAIQNSQISAIVASKWMKDKIEQSPIWKDKKVYLVPFGINQELFKPNNIIESKRKLGISPNKFVIFFRSDKSKFKGLETIKQLLSTIKNKNDFTIVTVGETGLLKEFKSKYEILEYGWLKDDQELVKLYQACDIFLMPSTQEAFGMMAIEAMSCAKTVLVLNGTSLPDVINAPECGIAVESQNFTEEFIRLFHNPQELIERGKKSLDFARENYSKEIYLERIISAYKDIISNHTMDEENANMLKTIKSAKSIVSLQSVAPPPLTASQSSLNAHSYSLSDYKKLRKKYKKYGILRKITFGKLKSKYKARHKELKTLVKEIERYI